MVLLLDPYSGQLKHHLGVSTLHRKLQKGGSDAVNRVVEETPLIRWDEESSDEQPLGSRSRSRSRSPSRPTVARGKVKEEPKGEGKGKAAASGSGDSQGVWTEAAGQDRARVLVDRAELQCLVEDCRVVLHNAERLLRHISEA